MKHALWKDARDNGVSNSAETPPKQTSRNFTKADKGSPVTTWADILSYRPRSSSNEAANHKHEHQTCYLLVAAPKVYTKVHDNKVGVLTCPRLMRNNKNCKSAHHEISESKISDDSWNCRQPHCHSKIRLLKKIKEVKGSAKGSAEKPCMKFSDITWTVFLPIWSMLLFGDPVQCSPVARFGYFQAIISMDETRTTLPK